MTEVKNMSLTWSKMVLYMSAIFGWIFILMLLYLAINSPDHSTLIQFNVIGEFWLEFILSNILFGIIIISFRKSIKKDIEE